MAYITSSIESKNKTYYWVYLEKYQYEPLFVHKITIDNKLLMSSIPELDENNEGYIIYEAVSILENQKVFFLGPKSISRSRVLRPSKKDLELAIKKYKPNPEKVK